MDAELFSVPGSEPQPAPMLLPLVEGFRRALRGWPVLLLMLLGTLLTAGLLALVPAFNLLGVANRPAIERMAAGVTSWQLVDLIGLLGRSAQQTVTASPLRVSLAELFIAFFAMPFVGGLVSAFLYGGVLLTYLEDARTDCPRPFGVRRFMWGCWRWFGSNLVLAMLQGGLFFALYLPLTSMAVYWSKLGPGGTAAALGLGLLLDLLGIIIFELARAWLVVSGRRNPFTALGQAARAFFRRPLPILVMYVAVLLGLLVVQIVFRLGINPRVPLDSLLLALAAQQGFILARLFVQAVRLAGLVRLLQAQQD